MESQNLEVMGSARAFYQSALDAFHRITALVGPSQGWTQSGGWLAPAYGDEQLHSFSLCTGQSVCAASFFSEMWQSCWPGRADKSPDNFVRGSDFFVAIFFED